MKPKRCGQNKNCVGAGCIQTDDIQLRNMYAALSTLGQGSYRLVLHTCARVLQKTVTLRETM